MALDRDMRRSDPTIVAPVGAQKRLGYDHGERDTGRSNFAAFLLGGVVISGGLLAFLYYDTDNLSRGDSLTTGSITQSVSRDGPQAPPVLRIPVQPSPSSGR